MESTSVALVVGYGRRVILDGRNVDAAGAVLVQRGWLAEQPAELQGLILGAAHVRRAVTGAALYRQGDHPAALYGLAAGSVKFSSFSHDGREVIGNLLARGAWFGELGLFDGLPRAQTATVLRDVVLLEVPFHTFRRLIADEPWCTWNFASLMSRNLRAALYYNYEVLPCPPQTRVIRLLQLLAREDEPGPLRLEIGQQQLADLADLSRQTVNRVLQDLMVRGLVSCGYRHIVVQPALLHADD